MARNFQDTPINALDIKEYVQAQDDFSLEVRAFQACKNNGFEASHGGTYVDPVEKKNRQFDLRAALQKQDLLKVQLAVECKALKPFFPLVVSRIPRTANESYHEIVQREKVAGTLMTQHGTFKYTVAPQRYSGKDAFYREGSRVGKATARIGRLQPSGKQTVGELTSDDSEVYNKWSQAIASAYDMIINAATASSGREIQHKNNFYTITLPVLVVSDGTLWTVDYDADGTSSEPKQADECEYYIGKEYYIDVLPKPFVYTVSHLHIFTFTAFTKRIGTLAYNDRYWPTLFPSSEAK